MVLPQKQDNRCTILVNSCDAYADVWPLFCAAFQEHWANCPYPLLINTESIEFSDPNINARTHVIHNSAQRSPWGRRLLSTLEDLTTEYVIMLFDDFVLEDRVDEECISTCINRMNADPGIAVFYLSNISGELGKPSVYDGFDELPRVISYRLNSAPAVWRRQDLIKLTRSDDDPWIWELFGTSRTFLHPGKFFCAQPLRETTYRYNYEMGGAIYRGKWVSHVAGPLIDRYGLGIDMSVRGVVAEVGAPRTIFQKLKMVARGFQASGWLAPVIIWLLIKSKLRVNRSKI